MAVTLERVLLKTNSNDAENLDFFSCFRRTESPTHMSELLACRLFSPYSFIFSFPRASFLCASLCLLEIGFLVIHGNFLLIALLYNNSEGEIFVVVCGVDLQFNKKPSDLLLPIFCFHRKQLG